MALATWWRGDPLPSLPPLDSFRAVYTRDETVLARLGRLDPSEIRRRLAAGHRPYVGYLAETAVAYGWVATRCADIGELGLAFRLPRRNRYLWDFATLPQWRGRGVYPHLLQAILRQELPQADAFWIIRAPENGPSGAGIGKAGFTAVGKLSLLADGRAGLAASGEERRAAAGAALLGVPLVGANLFPCWHCGGAAYPAAAMAAHCVCDDTTANCVCAA
jgi:GNAT superfamily N-acetyltransferase